MKRNSKNQIEDDLTWLETFRIVSQAYAQISSFRVKNMRDNVLATRDFLAEFALLFKQVLLSYRREASRVVRGKSGEKVTFLSHNARSVAVFLSANSRLYGEVILRTFEDFAREIKDRDIEVTIIGKYGLSLYEERFPDKPFTYFDLSDSKSERAEFDNIISHLVQYEEIRFYFPQFQNVLKQDAKSLVITAGEAIVTEGEKNIKHQSYLFEPSLEEVLQFFEGEIFSSIIEQTIKESRLAKFASRLVSMDNASQKAKELLGIKSIEKLNFIHNNLSKKQIESLTTTLYM